MIRAIGAYTLSECMDIVSDLVYRAEREDGQARNVVFCEDRLTLIAERAITKKLGGSFRTYVTTYARALKTRGKVLTKQGSVIVLDSIVSALQKEGKLKRFVRGVPRGMAKSLYETIAQFAASDVDEDTLLAASKSLGGGVLKDKVKDIAKIYAEYEAFLRENSYVDESGYLALLPKSLEETGALRGANVYFLCYGSFTAQAAKTLKTAFASAANVTGIFCYGKEEFYAGAGWKAYISAAKEYGGAQEVDAGVALQKEAEVLRKGIFNPSSFARGREKYETGAVRIFEAGDKNEEMEKIAVKIKRFLATHPDARYRDFAVLASDAKGYTLAVKKAFSEYGIPYYLDEKRSLKTHPLSEFLFSCFDAVRTGLLPDSVDSVLQNPFFAGDCADEYRNYLLKHANYRGGARKEIREPSTERGAFFYDKARVERNRERLLDLLSLVPKKGRGKAYCDAVREILKRIDASSRLKETASKVQDAALKGYLSQIDGTLFKVLAEAETLLESREMTIAEFLDVLKDGLDATEISFIPVKTDAVFVGDINDSRIEKVRVLFAVGLDSSVPKNTSDTSLISDREIKELEGVNAKTEPTVEEVNRRAAESVALNLCTFTDEAHFSYALSADGNETALSEIFRYIDALFCDEKGEALVMGKGWKSEELPYRCSAFSPAVKRWYELRGQDEKAGIFYGEECNAVEQALSRVQGGSWAKEAYDAEDAGEYLSVGDGLFFRGGKSSPSALETYFSCPFKHFLKYGLHLKEREEQTVMATDSGNFIHELLQKTADVLESVTTEEEAKELARNTADEILKNPPYSYGAETVAGRYAQMRLKEEGVAATAAVFRQLKGSLYRVEKTEKKVETEYFRGMIDRVDESGDFVRVIDYKTGSIDETPAAYYTGRKIQLQLYMTAVKGEKIPAATFYFPASLSYEEEGKAFKMKGFFCNDEDALIAGDVRWKTYGEGEEYEFFGLKNNGRSNSRAMDSMTFSDFIDYSTLVTKTAREEISQGYIAASPYEEACKFCPYGGACEHDCNRGFFRGTDFTVSAKTIASIVRQKKEEEDRKESAAREKDGLLKQTAEKCEEEEEKTRG